MLSYENDDSLYNINKDVEERLSKLYVFEGSRPVEVPELHAGDIGAIGKLSHARTGDSLSVKTHPIQYAKLDISVPYTCVEYLQRTKVKKTRLHRLCRRCPMKI